MRNAASCGQAYTQLGSVPPGAMSLHRSQVVAFRSFATTVLPGRAGSSFFTGVSTMLMLPYGQFSAYSPQPMHQLSMRISKDPSRRIDPTGQPTMQYGSRHDRHDVATR